MCGDTGIDDIVYVVYCVFDTNSMQEVCKCSVPTCGKHYHYRCLVSSDAPHCITSTQHEVSLYLLFLFDCIAISVKSLPMMHLDSSFAVRIISVMFAISLTEGR